MLPYSFNFFHMSSINDVEFCKDRRGSAHSDCTVPSALKSCRAIAFG
jgi:hypothetical protein